MKLIIFSCVIALAYCQVPTPCVSPKQWEGRILTTDRSKDFTQYGKISYDETTRRVRVLEEVAVGTARDYYDNLYLHNVGKAYQLNLRTKKCNVSSLTRPFRPFGVPPNAQFEGSANVGAAGIPGEYMVVTNFFGNFTDGDRFGGVVTSPDCYPVASTFYSNSTGYVHHNMFDINLGIADPNVFVPPPQCA